MTKPGRFLPRGSSKCGSRLRSQMQSPCREESTLLRSVLQLRQRPQVNVPSKRVDPSLPPIFAGRDATKSELKSHTEASRASAANKLLMTRPSTDAGVDATRGTSTRRLAGQRPQRPIWPIVQSSYWGNRFCCVFAYPCVIASR
jgi:hypothetical protein